MDLRGMDGSLPSSAINHTSEDELPNEHILGASQLTPAEDYVAALYLLVLWCVSAYLNGVVLVGLFYQKRQKSPVDFLMGHLAFSNAALALITYPLMGVSLLHHRWFFGVTGCVAYSFITMLFGLVSIWILLGISWTISSSIRSSENSTPERLRRQHPTVFRFMVAIYAISFFFCVLPLFGVGEYGHGQQGTFCTLNWSKKSESSTIYITALLVAGFCVPLLGTTIFYSTALCSVCMYKGGPVPSALTRSWSGIRKKTWAMSVGICLCMIVCWAPYSLTAMWETYGDSKTLPVRLEAASAMFAKSSTAFAPMIQLWFAKKFRMWLSQFPCCFQNNNVNFQHVHNCTRQGALTTDIRISLCLCGDAAYRARRHSISTESAQDTPRTRKSSPSLHSFRSNVRLLSYHIDHVVNEV